MTVHDLRAPTEMRALLEAIEQESQPKDPTAHFLAGLADYAPQVHGSAVKDLISTQ